MRTHYHAASAGSVMGLANIVEKMITRGWVPLGGVSVTCRPQPESHEKAEGDDPTRWEFHMFQAMVRQVATG